MSAGGDDVLRVGIVGCGGIARSHGRAYAADPRVELVAVHDVDPSAAEAFAAEVGARACSSVADLVAQDVQLVSVCTPPGTHTDTTVELLGLGTSVLLEKPPTVNLADMDRIAQAESTSAGAVFVVFQHRHGSGAKRAHRLLAEGTLGVPQVAVCETLWYRPDSYFDPAWRGNWAGEGGGPTLGHGIHQIDLLLHLLGEWRTVDARATRVARPVEFEDVSTASVTFASGAVASVTTSLLSPRETSRIRIDTTGGTLEVEHLYGYTDADWSWYPLPDARTAAANGTTPVPGSVPPAPRTRRTSGPPRPGRTCRRTTPRRSTTSSATCSRAARTRRPWRAPVPRWSSSRRCTPPPSRARPSPARTSRATARSTTASTAGCPPNGSPPGCPGPETSVPPSTRTPAPPPRLDDDRRGVSMSHSRSQRPSVLARGRCPR